MKNIGKFVVNVLSIIVSSVISGFALLKLWSWLVIPVFNAAPTLSLAKAIGLMILISYLKFDRRDDVTTENFMMKVGEGVLYTITSSSVALLCGYVVALFF